MKTDLVIGADFAGSPLKEAVCAHLRAKGWKITDLGVTADSDPDKDTDLMFHRVGLRVGAEISEGNFERALLRCVPSPATASTCWPWTNWTPSITRSTRPVASRWTSWVTSI